MLIHEKQVFPLAKNDQICIHVSIFLSLTRYPMSANWPAQECGHIIKSKHTNRVWRSKICGLNWTRVVMGWALPQSGFWQRKGNFRPFRFLAFVHPESRHGGGKSIITGLFRIEICDLTDCNLPVTTNTVKPRTSALSLGVHGLLKVSHLLSHLGSHYISWEKEGCMGRRTSTSTHLKMIYLINSCILGLKNQLSWVQVWLHLTSLFKCWVVKFQTQ